MTRHRIALAGALTLLVALPWLLLSRERTTPAPPPRIDNRPLQPQPAVAIDTILDRDPFRLTAGEPATDPEPASPDDTDGPPALVGIAGRLPDHAVVLVRRASGGTRTLAVGEAVGRWRLLSIAADAALFGDGTQQARVELPTADPPQ